MNSKIVLLVEDDAWLRQAIGESLEDEGYRVAMASDGQEALEWLSASPTPQAIITDLLMPRMDGWELCRRLRTESAWMAIPVFVLSAATDARPWPVYALPIQQMRKPPDLDRLLHLLDDVAKSPASIVAAASGAGY